MTGLEGDAGAGGGGSGAYMHLALVQTSADQYRQNAGPVRTSTPLWADQLQSLTKLT